MKYRLIYFVYRFLAGYDKSLAFYFTEYKRQMDLYHAASGFDYETAVHYYDRADNVLLKIKRELNHK